jgi:hypothetical protein
MAINKPDFLAAIENNRDFTLSRLGSPAKVCVSVNKFYLLYI